MADFIVTLNLYSVSLVDPPKKSPADHHHQGTILARLQRLGFTVIARLGELHDLPLAVEGGVVITSGRSPEILGLGYPTWFCQNSELANGYRNS